MGHAGEVSQTPWPQSSGPPSEPPPGPLGQLGPRCGYNRLQRPRCMGDLEENRMTFGHFIKNIRAHGGEVLVAKVK